MSEVIEKPSVLVTEKVGQAENVGSEPSMVSLLTGKDPERAIATVIDRLVA